MIRDSDAVGTEFVVSISDGDDISDADIVEGDGDDISDAEIVEGNSPSILCCIN